MQYENFEEVNIPAGTVSVTGNLAIPVGAVGLVVFAHGSGSSRLSSRNKAVAVFLQEKGFGTLLFDLLTPEEDMDYTNRFNIDLLADRLIAATNWLIHGGYADNKRIGFFGASTGAAAALKAAAKMPRVSAVVSRGGRPDLAGESLRQVTVPVLLIVGALDDTVLQLNQEAYRQLPGLKQLSVVEGATHLFEEAAKIQIVSTHAAEWFATYLQET